jgi:branched-chain amino acid aminotransferase
VIQILEDNGFPVIERDIARSELYLADEIFMCGTAAEVVPVREVDDHPVGDPGEVTRLVQTRYEDAIYGRAPEYHEWLDLVGEPEPASEPSKVDG